MLCPWEFQDPKIEVLKHTRPYIIYIWHIVYVDMAIEHVKVVSLIGINQ